ncbi:MAG: tetratricopeptide repeat protein, partial [Gemmatimonadales bacterium]
NVDQAIEHIEGTISSGADYPDPQAGLACAKAAAGDVTEAETILGKLLEIKASDDRYVSSRAIAMVYSRIGDERTALDWLERAFREHDAWMSFIAVDPLWDGIRQEPRFRSLVDEMGLTEIRPA